MKFIVSSAKLLKHLQQVSGVLSSNSSLPILDNFLLQFDKTNLIITASDIETSMTTSMEVDGKDAGKIAIPAKFLMDTLKAFADQPLTLTVDTKENKMSITSDSGFFEINGANAEEYPEFPELKDATLNVMAADILQRAFAKTLFATSNDEIRMVMTGVFCQIESNQITFASTDAHKLVKYTRTDFKSDIATEFILPKKPITLLKNLFNDPEEEVKLSYNKTNVMFETANVKLVCRLIDGKYPNYQAVIPKESPNELTIAKGTFLNAVKRVSIFANKTTHQVRLKLTANNLEVSAEDIDFNNRAEEKLTCAYAGEDLEIGFNSRFLQEMLNHLDAEEVTLSMSAPNRAGILTPTEKIIEGEDVLMLVMPVMLNH